MSNQGDFYQNIKWWSLEFNNPEFEQLYQEERLHFKRVPSQVRWFFIIAVSVLVILILLDWLATYFSYSYSYSFYDILSLALYVPVLGLEYLFYACSCLNRFRGLSLTLIAYFVVLSSTMISAASTWDYPVMSPTYSI